MTLYKGHVRSEPPTLPAPGPTPTSRYDAYDYDNNRGKLQVVFRGFPACGLRAGGCSQVARSKLLGPGIANRSLPEALKLF